MCTSGNVDDMSQCVHFTRSLRLEAEISPQSLCIHASVECCGSVCFSDCRLIFRTIPYPLRQPRSLVPLWMVSVPSLDPIEVSAPRKREALISVFSMNCSNLARFDYTGPSPALTVFPYDIGRFACISFLLASNPAPHCRPAD